MSMGSRIVSGIAEAGMPQDEVALSSKRDRMCLELQINP